MKKDWSHLLAEGVSILERTNSEKRLIEEIKGWHKPLCPFSSTRETHHQLASLNHSKSHT